MTESFGSTDKILGLLKRFGISGSEGKAYLALLRENPATGYEIASRGKVPRSAIYGCLKKLEDAGLIVGLPGKPARYLPKSPAQVVKQFEGRLAHDLKQLEESLVEYGSLREDAPTWSIRGFEAISAEIERMINDAEEALYMSVWEEDAERFANAIRNAISRGVDVVLFSFTRVPEFACPTLSYGIDSAELQNHWPKRITVLADRTQLFTGDRAGAQEDSATYSEEPSLREMALANLVLDVTLFGQRQGQDVSPIVTRLTPPLAPIDELVKTEKE